MANAPSHYSPIVSFENLLFTSGQLPLVDPKLKIVAEGIEAQTVLVLQKVENLLEAYNLDRTHILKTTAFICNMDDWSAVNEVYAKFFGDHKPARSIIPVSELHYGCLIELEAIIGIPQTT